MTALPIPGSRANLPAELGRVERDIAYLESVIAARPDSSEPARRMLASEQAHAEQLRATLRLNRMG